MKLKYKKNRSLNVKYDETKQSVATWRYILLVIIISLPILYIIGNFVFSHLLVIDTGVITYNTYTIRSNDKVIINSVNVLPGKSVTKGTILAECTYPGLIDKIKFLKDEISDLKTKQNIFQPESQKDLEKMLSRAQENNKKYHALYKKYVALRKEGVVSILELMKTLQLKESAEKHLYDVNEKIKQNKREHAIQHQTLYTNKLFELKEKLFALLQKNKGCEIKSTYDAKVLDRYIAPGEHAADNQPLFLLRSLDNPIIIVYLRPKFAKYAEIGKEVSIILPNYDIQKGTIERKTDYSEEKPLEKSMIEKRKNLILVWVKPSKPLPKAFQVHGLHVKVKF